MKLPHLAFYEEASLGLPKYNHRGLEWSTNEKFWSGIFGQSSLSLQPMLSSYDGWMQIPIPNVRFVAEALLEDWFGARKVLSMVEARTLLTPYLPSAGSGLRVLPFSGCFRRDQKYHTCSTYVRSLDAL
jgi:hypothetical protein